MASNSRSRSVLGRFGLRRRSREPSAVRGGEAPLEGASTVPPHPSGDASVTATPAAQSSVHLPPHPPDYASVLGTPVPAIDAPSEEDNQLTLPVGNSLPIASTGVLERDLWGQAALDLHPRIITRLKGVPQDSNQTASGAVTSNHPLPGSDIDSVLELTKQRSKLEQDKVWKRRWNSLIRSVSACKTLVDAGLQFDPTGYGALAWSVVSFGLQTAINNSDIQQAVFESSDYIRGVIDEYSMYEARYIEKPSNGQSALRSCIINVYKAVITYAAELRYYLDHRLEALKGLQDSSFVTFKATIEEKKAAARDIIYDIRSEFSEAELATIESKIEDVLLLARQISRMTEYVSRKDDEDVLDWVSDVNMGVAHKTQRNYAVAKGREKPGAWILSETAYLAWEAAESSSNLWLSGGVGTGKTILASTVIEDRSGIYGKDPYGPIAFFYCTGVPGNGQKGVTTEAILCSILRQIMESSEAGLNFVRTKWRAEHKLRSLTQVEVLLLIRQIIEHQDTLEVTIIVDGLDELDAESLNGLLGSLSDLQNAAGILKIFAASRWVQRVEDFLGDGFRIENSPNNTRSDINIYINTTVDTQLKGRRGLEEGLDLDIKSTLKERAQGMFRYVELAMKFIFDKSTRMIRQRLEELPKPEFGDAGLQPMYEKLYGLIENDDEMSQLLAHRTMQWLLYQMVPLQSKFMIEGICIDNTGPAAKKLHEQYRRHQITAEEVYAACHHLVIHNHETDSLEFGHFSVVEFLTWLNAPIFSKPIAHSTLSVACLRSLLSKPNKTNPDDRYMMNLNTYALLGWGWHCRNTTGAEDLIPFYGLLTGFLNEGDFLEASLSKASRELEFGRDWHRGSNLAKNETIWAALNPGVVAKSPQSLQRWLVACAFDLVTPIREILNKKRDFELLNPKELVAGFKLALHSGSINTVQLLLDHGIDDTSIRASGVTMLHHAANSLNTESLKKILQETPTPINAIASGACQVPWKTTPLIVALGSMNYNAPFRDIEFMQLLLGAPGIDVHATGFLGETAMHMITSTFAVRPEIVKLVLNMCATDIYCRDVEGVTPMAIARDRADKSSDLRNKYISDQWAELGHQVLDSRATFLSYDGPRQLQLLLSAEWPLHAAARTGDLDKLREIVDQDDWREDTKYQDLLTALFLAAENGNVNSTEFLLNTGLIDVNAQSRDGFSVLMAAMLSRPASSRLIRLLRAKGASVTMETHRGKNAFFFAIEKGNLDTVKALLSFVRNYEVNINHQDSVTGSTPLHYAYEKKVDPYLPWSSELKANLVEYLLGCHARRDIRNKKGQTPSQVAEEMTSSAAVPITEQSWEGSFRTVEEEPKITIGSWQSFAPISELPLLLKELHHIEDRDFTMWRLYD